MIIIEYDSEISDKPIIYAPDGIALSVNGPAIVVPVSHTYTQEIQSNLPDTLTQRSVEYGPHLVGPDGMPMFSKLAVAPGYVVQMLMDWRNAVDPMTVLKQTQTFNP